jgi:hypothetical protein
VCVWGGVASLQFDCGGGGGGCGAEGTNSASLGPGQQAGEEEKERLRADFVDTVRRVGSCLSAFLKSGGADGNGGVVQL